MTQTEDMVFRAELTALINRHSREKKSDTPDFILSVFLKDCLAAFDRATNSRTAWYGEASPAAKEGAKK